MAKSTKSDVIIPELWDEAVQGEFAGKNAFMGSLFVASGAAVVAGDMPAGKPEVGNEIKVPYFGILGDFDDLANDGDAAVPKKLSQTQELATVKHAALAFESTFWSQSGAGMSVYDEGKRQMMASATRKMDQALIDAASAAGTLTNDVSASSRTLDYDLMVDSLFLLGDEASGGDIAAAIVHSKVKAQLLKLKDGSGRPLLTLGQNEGDFDRFAGIPLGVSDRLSVAGSTMSSVTSAGTSPPTVTLSGTPNGKTSQILIDIVVGGTLGVATFRFSTDGGQTWSATLTTAASVVLSDTAVDSMVGANGVTGLTAGFAAGTYNADNTYTATTSYKFTSLILKRRSLAFWYNRAALSLKTDKDILVDSDIAAMHLYYAAHRYRRARGGTTPGVVRVVHV